VRLCLCLNCLNDACHLENKFSAHKGRDIASRQLVANHPHHDVFAALKRAIYGVKRNVVSAAEAIAIVAVDEDRFILSLPDHQRITTAFGQQRCFQRFAFFHRQRRNQCLEFRINNEALVVFVQQFVRFLPPAARQCQTILFLQRTVGMCQACFLGHKTSSIDRMFC
jgi:hypothetical protein